MSNRHASEESVSYSSSADKTYQRGQISIPSKKIPDVPGAPTVGAATDTGVSRAFNNAQVSIPVTSANTGGPTVSYTATSTPGDISGTSTTSPVLVSGLTSGVAYTFNVVANNSTGSSPAVTTSPITATSVPAAPTITYAHNLANSPFNNGAMSVAFTPDGSGGKSVSSYTVTSSPDGLSNSGQSPVTITGLRSNTAYTFTVTATNANGTSAASTPSSSVTVTTVPDVPVIGTVTVTNATTVSIPFTAPASGGLSITGYTVSSSPSIPLGVGTNSGTLTVIGNFLPSVFYTFTVSAVNTNGSSVASAPSNAVAPIPLITDNFQRTTSGSLGTSSSGGLWQAIKGTWFANGSAAQTNDSASNDSIAAVNLQSPLVTISTLNPSLGAGVSFMVQDSNNWWAAVGIESDSYTYAYNYSYLYSYTYSRYVAGYNYTATGYGFAEYSYIGSSGQIVYGSGSYSYTYTGNYGGTRTGTAYAYGYSNSNAPSPATVINYYLNLYRSVSGTVTTVASTAISSIANAIRVVVTGNTATASAYSDTSFNNLLGSATSGSITFSGNLHGIILTPSAQNQGNTTGAFSAQVTG